MIKCGLMMMICNYYTCFLSSTAEQYSAGNSVKVCIMLLMAPIAEYIFHFPETLKTQGSDSPRRVRGQRPGPGQVRAAEEMGNVTAKNFKHRGFSLKQERGNVMFNI